MLKRSKNVSLTILTAIALTACDEETSGIKHCVDENDVVQEEDHCNPTTPDGGVNPVYHPGFRWYYGGYSAPQSPGTKVGGGSYDPSPNIHYSPPSISKGGFGGTGEGFGGAHGGGGGGE